MKALLISDIQGDPGNLSHIKDIGKKLEISCIFCAGDLNNWNKKIPEISQYSEIHKYLKSIGNNLFLVDGNHDNTDLMKHVFGKDYTETRNADNFLALAHNNMHHGDLKTFIKQQKDHTNFHEFYTKKINSSIDYFLEKSREYPKIDIFMTHVPPYTEHTEKTTTGNSILNLVSDKEEICYLTGKTIRLLEKTNPLLFLSGHRTNAFFGRYRGTYFISAGTFSDKKNDTGSFMMLDINFEKRHIDCELYRIDRELEEVYKL